MIDINDHAEEYAAALEYARRARKHRGGKSDRWTDGTDGAKLVAQGIEAMQRQLDFQSKLLADQADVMRAIWSDLQVHMANSEASMEPSADPMRNDKA